jgi:DNA modification methylase
MDIPDLIIADPPYEFENKGCGLYSFERFKKQMGKIADIGTNSFDFKKFIPKLLDLQGDKVNAYFFCNKKLLPLYLQEAVKRKLIFDVLIFRKLNPVPAFNNSHMNELEYIVFLRSPRVYFSSKEGYENYKKDYAENIGHHGLIHPNQKPLKLIKRFVRISCPVVGLVYVPFCGSGTEIVACKELKRDFVASEINESYVNVSKGRVGKAFFERNLNDF